MQALAKTLAFVLEPDAKMLLFTMSMIQVSSVYLRHVEQPLMLCWPAGYSDAGVAQSKRVLMSPTCHNAFRTNAFNGLFHHNNALQHDRVTRIRVA
jgi:hypothetical protein